MTQLLTVESNPVWVDRPDLAWVYNDGGAVAYYGGSAVSG